jgi:outer membrane receptor for ferrienterochelin and colicins
MRRGRAPHALVCQVALGAALLWGLMGAPARAQAPKAPALKPPALKVPEVKAPPVQRPEPKLPGVKAPELAPPERQAPGPKPPEKKTAGDEVPAGPDGAELPPELTGVVADPSEVRIREIGDNVALTIKDIVNSAVTTASNRSENALDAPAWVITLTGAELKARGYQELTDLLDDLPGMDVVRGWGDSYFKNYWRGYRKNVGDPFLLLVDGVDFTHLWYGEAQIMAALPLSNVERVEVVYGPTSALYGPNAAMGVINVVTRRDQESDFSAHAQSVLRSPQRSLGSFKEMTKVTDINAFYKGRGFRISLTGRFDVGMLDPSLGKRFEWLKDEYYNNASLWGDFLKVKAFSHSFYSPSEKQAIDARLILESRNQAGALNGETEVAAQLYRMLAGAGLIYAADRVHSNQWWTLLEQSLSIRHQHQLSSTFSSSTLLRYRRSNVDSPTAWLERNPDRDAAEGNVRFLYFQSLNSSVSLSHGFDWAAGSNLFFSRDSLRLSFGFQYERKDLQKGTYSFGGWVDPRKPIPGAPDEIEFPLPLGPGDHLENRSPLGVGGVYLLSNYMFSEDHALHLGMRLDYNTVFARVEPSFRGGYVGHLLQDSLAVKLFYGQAIETPGWRILSDSNASQLALERSGTLELGLDYTLSTWVLHGTLYYVHFKGVLDESLEGFRQIAGGDLGATALLNPPGIRQLRLWGYYSTYLLARQFYAQAPETPVLVGDLARHKLMLGATLEFNRALSVTGLGRCIGQREPVRTNPLGPVPGYCVVDANLLLQSFLIEGGSIAFHVSNLLDTQYAHPGLYEANSNNFPGRWEADQWIGSQGETNSQMPQPGRAFSLQFGLQL